MLTRAISNYSPLYLYVILPLSSHAISRSDVMSSIFPFYFIFTFMHYGIVNIVFNIFQLLLYHRIFLPKVVNKVFIIILNTHYFLFLSDAIYRNHEKAPFFYPEISIYSPRPLNSNLFPRIWGKTVINFRIQFFL